jgi:heme/copper-type cytochrome/quinol oxidase subunit 1
MNESGWRAWAFTRDHERIALLYLATLTVTFLLGGVCALLMRLELAAPGQQIMDRDAYSRVLTVHGALMVFGFLIPCIPSSFGNLLVPRQIGAREVALPRLSLLSLYLLVLAILLSVVSTEPYGFYLAALSYALTSANLIATVHTKRTVDRLPSFVWVMYITSALQLCALLASAARMLRSGSAPLRELSAYAPIAVQLMVLPGAGLTYELYRSGRAKRWAHSALALFTLGELIGLWLATFPAHSHIHDTYVVIANFHFVMVGGTVMAFLGADAHGPQLPRAQRQHGLARRAARLCHMLLRTTPTRPAGHAAPLRRLPTALCELAPDELNRRVDHRDRTGRAAHDVSSICAIAAARRSPAELT